MDAEQKKVFRNIARCPIADRILDDLLDSESGNEGRSSGSTEAEPCSVICGYQQGEISQIGERFGLGYEVAFGKNTFHMPEPWNGNLKTAEILFVSSNPSFDIYETTEALAKDKPELHRAITGKQNSRAENFPKFDSKEWPDSRVEEFFENRFSHEEYRNRTWTGTLKYAGYLLGETDSIKRIENKDQIDSIASRIALTEVVHCKSPKQKGVSLAAEKCYKEHTRGVIELFLKYPSAKPKLVVVAGNEARKTFFDAIDEGTKKRFPNATEDELGKLAQEDFGDLGKNARFIVVPHAVASISDKSRQKTIDLQLKS